MSKTTPKSQTAITGVNRRNRRHYAKRRTTGGCVRCARRAMPGMTMCRPCREARAKYLRTHYALMRQAYIQSRRTRPD